MGGMISLLEAADRPGRVAGLVLVDPAVPRPRGVRRDPEIALVFAAYAVPGLGERLLARHRARVGPEGMVSDVLQVCCAEPEQIPTELVDVLRASTRERVGFAWADAAFLQAARSLIATPERGRRSRCGWPPRAIACGHSPGWPCLPYPLLTLCRYGCLMLQTPFGIVERKPLARRRAAR